MKFKNNISYDLQQELLFYISNGINDKFIDLILKIQKQDISLKINVIVKQINLAIILSKIQDSLINNKIIDIDESTILFNSIISSLFTLTTINSIHEYEIKIMKTISKISTNTKILETNDIVDNIIKYINIYTKSQFSISDLCNTLNISKSYASQLFKEQTNMTMKQYHMDLKLTKSKELLKITDKDISYVYTLLGFYDQAHFTKKFKIKYGITPYEYKKNINK